LNPFNRSFQSGQCAEIDAFGQIVPRINDSFSKKIGTHTSWSMMLIQLQLQWKLIH